MRVLLRSDISGVGKKGDIVDVARGFAANYLFPHGRALAATGRVEAQAASMRKSRALRDAQDKEEAQAVAAVLGLPGPLVQATGHDHATSLGQRLGGVLRHLPPAHDVEERRGLFPFIGSASLPTTVHRQTERRVRLAVSCVANLWVSGQIA